MKIVTYVSAEHGAVARILMDGGFLPVIVSAATEEAVRTKAQAFWDTERARLQGGGKPRGALAPEQIDLEEAIAATPANPLEDILG